MLTAMEVCLLDPHKLTTPAFILCAMALTQLVAVNLMLLDMASNGTTSAVNFVPEGRLDFHEGPNPLEVTCVPQLLEPVLQEAVARLVPLLLPDSDNTEGLLPDNHLPGTQLTIDLSHRTVLPFQIGCLAGSGEGGGALIVLVVLHHHHHHHYLDHVVHTRVGP